MSKLLKSCFIAIILLMVCCTLLAFAWEHSKDECKRLERNQTSLLEQVDYYKTEAGKSAASVQELTLTKKEVEDHCVELTNMVDELGIKLKRVQQATTTAMESKVEIRTIVKDSIIYVNNTTDTMKSFTWSDYWTDIAGTLHNNEAKIAIHSVDTLRQIVHRVPKRFLWFKFGTKAIRQEIVSSNPHNKIVYSEFVAII